MTTAGNPCKASENIHTGHPLNFVDTPIGRMATLICLDYLQKEVCDTVGIVHCDYLWVPLMTTSIGMFVSHARDVYGAKHHVLSACSASRSCCEMITGKLKDLSFLYAPSKRCGDVESPRDIDPNESLPLIIYDLDSRL